MKIKYLGKGEARMCMRDESTDDVLDEVWFAVYKTDRGRDDYFLKNVPKVRKLLLLSSLSCNLCRSKMR